MCDALVADDKAVWVKPEKDKTRCMITRQPMRMWADAIMRVVSVRFVSKTTTLENLYSGEDVEGTGAAFTLQSSSSCVRSRQCSMHAAQPSCTSDKSAAINTHTLSCSPAPIWRLLLMVRACVQSSTAYLRS